MGRRGSLRVLLAGVALVAVACGDGTSSNEAAPSTTAVLPAETVPRSTVVRTTTTTELVKPASVTLPVPTTPTTAAATTEAPTTAAPATPASEAPPPGAASPGNAARTPVPPPPASARDVGVVIGTIEIPKLGLSASLYEGITIPTLDKGPGYWPGTAMPGHPGNTVIAGHRTSKSRPFRYIDRLEEGDEIVLTTADGRFVYLVTGHEIVTPDAVWIVDQNTPAPQVTLFACHPPGSVAYRWVTRATLVT
jgi:sortase A